MKRLMISALATVVLFAGATTMLRSHAPSVDRPVGIMSLQAPDTANDVNQLQIEDFDDQSLVYSKSER